MEIEKHIPPRKLASDATLRDYFAAAALQGLLAGYYCQTTTNNLSEVPEEAFRIADAMIAEREKRDDIS